MTRGHWPQKISTRWANKIGTLFTPPNLFQIVKIFLSNYDPTQLLISIRKTTTSTLAGLKLTEIAHPTQQTLQVPKEAEWICTNQLLNLTASPKSQKVARKVHRVWLIVRVGTRRTRGHSKSDILSNVSKRTKRQKFDNFWPFFRSRCF